MWKYCIEWLQDICNDYENCGKYNKCDAAKVRREEVERQRLALINQQIKQKKIQRKVDDYGNK